MDARAELRLLKTLLARRTNLERPLRSSSGDPDPPGVGVLMTTTVIVPNSFGGALEQYLGWDGSFLSYSNSLVGPQLNVLELGFCGARRSSDPTQESKVHAADVSLDCVQGSLGCRPIEAWLHRV